MVDIFSCHIVNYIKCKWFKKTRPNQKLTYWMKEQGLTIYCLLENDFKDISKNRKRHYANQKKSRLALLILKRVH